MARIAQRFTDPVTNDTYDWPLNHSEEEEFGKERSISFGANTANTGLIKQQADAGPLVHQIRGKILEQSQRDAFIEWWQLCEDQTIYYRDFTGEQYEVIITSFKPVRKTAVANSRGGTTNPTWYFEYTMEMEVIRVISGGWSGVTP